MKIPHKEFRALKRRFHQMQKDRQPFWRQWRDLADYYLPSRYEALMSETELREGILTNDKVLDSTGTKAMRVLVAGMMNGITSPARPWFKLKLANYAEESHAMRVWLDEVERRMLLVMAGSNFYNALAINYIDLALFGVTCHFIYKDFDSVIRSYVPAVGEFYLAQDSRQVVNRVGRHFERKADQIIEQWGEENCSDTVKDAKKNNSNTNFTIHYLLEPNEKGDLFIPGGFKFREVYWEKAGLEEPGQVLGVVPYKDFLAITPRWEVTGNSVYATSCPAMDAMGDVRQLQHETMRKGQGLDKMVSPPVVMDLSLKQSPHSLQPNGKTFVPSASQVGVKSAYDVRLPIAELSADIQMVQASIRETFYNNLFQIVSNLDTVRSAREISSLEQERLTLLAPVLERFQNEALDPGVRRIYSVMEDADLLPEAPPEMEEAEIQISYISILAVAQSAVSTVPTERLLTLVGQTAALYPNALNIPDIEELIRSYGRDVGVKAAGLRSREETEQRNQQNDELNTQREQAATGEVLTKSAANLSETDVGGGQNALQQILSGI